MYDSISEAAPQPMMMICRSEGREDGGMEAVMRRMYSWQFYYMLVRARGICIVEGSVRAYAAKEMPYEYHEDFGF